MREAVQTYLSPSSRHKIYIILSFFSLVLLFCGVKQAYPVIVDRQEAFGLAAYLPAAYWAGLAIIVLTSVGAFLDKSIRKDIIYIVILLTAGMFLFGVTVFFEANPTQPDTYHPFIHVETLLTSHHMDIFSVPAGHTTTYYPWPAFHFINAALLEIPGIGPGGYLYFLKYMTLFFMVAFVIIVYTIGKQFKLESNYCFLITYLAMASWLIGFTGLYHPRLYAMPLFLLIFMLMLTTPRTLTWMCVTLFLFIGGLLTHGMVPMVVVPAAILTAIVRKDLRYLSLFGGILVLTAIWYLVVAPTSLRIGLGQLLNPFHELLHVAQIGRYQETTYPSAIVVRSSRLALAFGYAVLMGLCLILFLRKKMPPEDRKQVLSIGAFAIGIASSLIAGFGELIYRTYLHLVVPFLCIAGLVLPRRKIVTIFLVALMLAFTLAYLPAGYSLEGVYGQVLTTELKGVEFYATRVNPPGSSVFYSYGPHIILYYNKELITRIAITNSGQIYREYLDLTSKGVNLASPAAHLIDVTYLVSSVQTAEDPVVDWKGWLKTEPGEMTDVVYSNGYFTIYDNSMMRYWLAIKAAQRNG